MQGTQPARRTTAAGPPAATPLDGSRLVGSDRVLAVLKHLAGHPDGVSLEDLTRAIGSPEPTVHRALASLRRAGAADQDARDPYVLGDEFRRMAFAHHEARPDHARVRPALEAPAATFGETVHYAVLDGREIVYRAKVDPPSGGVRLSSTTGGRNPARCTAVGKLLLDADLRANRARGYAVDDQENEVGVNCLALPVFLTSPTSPSGAVSISALAYRTPLGALVDAVQEIRASLGPSGEAAR